MIREFSLDGNRPVTVTSSNVLKACEGADFEAALSALLTVLAQVLAQAPHDDWFEKEMEVALPKLVATARKIAAERRAAPEGFH